MQSLSCQQNTLIRFINNKIHFFTVHTFELSCILLYNKSECQRRQVNAKKVAHKQLTLEFNGGPVSLLIRIGKIYLAICICPLVLLWPVMEVHRDSCGSGMGSITKGISLNPHPPAYPLWHTYTLTPLQQRSADGNEPPLPNELNLEHNSRVKGIKLPFFYDPFQNLHNQ